MSYQTQRPNNPVLQQTQGKRQKTVQIKLQEFTGAAGAVMRIFDVFTPSARLSGIVEVFYETVGDDGGLTVVADYNSGWLIDAFAVGVTKTVARLHQVDPPLPTPPGTGVEIPRSYEFDSGNRVLRVNCTLGVPDVAAVAQPGSWYARVRWEPNVEMSDKELNDLFSNCALNPVRLDG